MRQLRVPVDQMSHSRDNRGNETPHSIDEPVLMPIRAVSAVGSSEVFGAVLPAVLC